MSKHRDNLKAIVGIGQTYEERLNDAGITTFRQLATATTAEIQEAANVSTSMVKYWKIEAENRI